MSSEKPVAKDLLGVAPYGEAMKIAVEKATETAQTFLYSICKPAADEFGLLLKDRVRLWRARNLANIANKAKELVIVNADGVQLCAHPRLVAEVVEHGSWCEDERLQSMWAGLLSSACTADGKDESNLVFADLLKRITTSEARFLAYVCERTRGSWGAQVELPESEMAKAMDTSDMQVVAYQLGHVRSLGLIRHPSESDWSHPMLKQMPATPAELGLHLYIRCQGSRKAPDDFFGWKKFPQDYPQ